MRCQLLPTLYPEPCLLQANVLIRGVVVLDVGWVVPNCYLDNVVHSNMEIRYFTELPTFLYVISVYVTYQEHSIVFHTWSDKLWVNSLSYFIGLLSTISFENVGLFAFKSWCHSIYIYDNYVYLSGLSHFISMHLFYMFFHTYAFYQVSCVIYYRV